MALYVLLVTKTTTADRASVRVIERKPVTWSRKELGSKAPVSFHTTDQKVRYSNRLGRTSRYKGRFKSLAIGTVPIDCVIIP